jgi:hypothetical protein
MFGASCVAKPVVRLPGLANSARWNTMRKNLADIGLRNAMEWGPSPWLAECGLCRNRPSRATDRTTHSIMPFVSFPIRSVRFLAASAAPRETFSLRDLKRRCRIGRSRAKTANCIAGADRERTCCAVEIVRKLIMSRSGGRADAQATRGPLHARLIPSAILRVLVTLRFATPCLDS